MEKHTKLNHLKHDLYRRADAMLEMKVGYDWVMGVGLPVLIIILQIYERRLVCSAEKLFGLHVE